jgi:hypothetical protein
MIKPKADQRRFVVFRLLPHKTVFLRRLCLEIFTVAYLDGYGQTMFKGRQRIHICSILRRLIVLGGLKIFDQRGDLPDPVDRQHLHLRMLFYITFSNTVLRICSAITSRSFRFITYTR